MSTMVDTPAPANEGQARALRGVLTLFAATSIRAEENLMRATSPQFP